MEKDWKELRKKLDRDFDRTVELWDFFMEEQKNGEVQVATTVLIEEVLLLRSEERQHRNVLYAALLRMEEEGLIKINKETRPHTYILNSEAIESFK